MNKTKTITKKTNKNLTNEQINIIETYYSSMFTKDLSEKFNISVNKIQNYAFAHNLKKNEDVKIFKKTKSDITLNQKQFILNNYATMSNDNIINKYNNLNSTIITSFANRHGLVKQQGFIKGVNHSFDYYKNMRNNLDYNIYDFINHKKESRIPCNKLYKSKYGKYAVNDNYFNIIDNEFKAYWLGFLYADGCVRISRRNNNKMEYSCNIALASIDKSHIEKFKYSLQSEAPIKDNISKIGEKTYYNSRIGICNRNLVEQLNNKGCTPNKSLTLKFPNNNIVPYDLIRHFIRGYFDGDGCVHINHDKKVISVSFVGTHDFLYDIMSNFTNNLDVSKKTVTQKKGQKAYSCAYSSPYECYLIYKYLYRDCNIYLDRKLKKFNTLFCLD